MVFSAPCQLIDDNEENKETSSEGEEATKVATIVPVVKVANTLSWRWRLT